MALKSAKKEYQCDHIMEVYLYYDRILLYVDQISFYIIVEQEAKDYSSIGSRRRYFRAVLVNDHAFMLNGS